jgi:hypothetical protein
MMFRRFRALYEAILGDFGRLCTILGDLSVGTLQKHTQCPGSWVDGTTFKDCTRTCPTLPPGEWARLCAVAESQGWEPRQERVMNYLLGDPGSGARDQGGVSHSFPECLGGGGWEDRVYGCTRTP